MASLSLRAWATSGVGLLDYGVQSLEIVQDGGALVVYASTGNTGGLVGYRLGAGGALDLQETQYYAGTEPVGNWMASFDGALLVGGSGASGLMGYDMQADGAIGSACVIGGLDASIGKVQALAQAGDGALYMSDGSGGIFRYDQGVAGNVTLQSATSSGADAALQNLNALASLNIGSNTYVLAADCAARGVLSYRVDPASGALSLRASMNADKGLGVMMPTDMKVAQVLGENFVILASASGSGGALSVLRVSSDGALVPTDHVLDTLETRFGAVQSLEVLESDGRVYVIAGGGDDGLSLFVLAPGGRLVHLDTIADTTTMGLDNVSAITAAVAGDRLEVLVASQSEAGLTRLDMSLADTGRVAAVSGAGGTLTGTTLDDILSGGVGADLLAGGAGDDILIGGQGGDTLTGGIGSDLYVLEGGGDPVRIEGFVPGRDKLDLSHYTMFYGMEQLDIRTTSWGARLTYRDEEVDILRDGGGGISADEIAAALHVAPDRPPLGLAREITGGEGGDVLGGHWGTDYIEGRAGNDQIAGGAGDDKLFGGLGNDRVVGEDGQDSVYGGSGWDTLFGGAGDDLVFGGDGRDVVYLGGGDDRFEDNNQTGTNAHDRAYGEAGDDILIGAGGDDTLFGGSGRDSVVGGDGDDALVGGSGDDWLFGGNGFDTLGASDGNDTVNGGNGRDMAFLGAGNDLYVDNAQGGDLGRDTVFADQGNDTIEGGNGDDAFYGGIGNDVIRSRLGNDLVQGGDGFDTLDSGDGNDTVNGGNGRDTAYLGAGNDLYVDNAQGGDLGRDTVFAGAGNDTIQGGNGNDEFFGGLGNDVIWARLGDDLIYGGDGDDTLVGGGGADTLTGGTGTNHFVFAAHHGGPDRITDFTVGVDRIVLDIEGLDYAGLALRDSAEGAVVDYASGSIVLEGVDAADLGMGDFLFR